MPCVTYSRFPSVLALAVVLLLAGCISASPASTSEPSESVPVDTATPGESLATVAPTETPTETPTDTPTETPTDTPTEPPTEPPTDAPTPEHPNWPPGAIDTDAAADHVGSSAVVCGLVSATNWLFLENGHPTFLNLDKPYPNVEFNVVIWGEQRRDWPLSGKPDVVYLDREVCVTGLIEEYDGRLQIQDVQQSQIQVVP